MLAGIVPHLRVWVKNGRGKSDRGAGKELCSARYFDKAKTICLLTYALPGVHFPVTTLSLPDQHELFRCGVWLKYR